MPPSNAPRKRKAASGLTFTKRAPPKMQRCASTVGGRLPAMEKLKLRTNVAPSKSIVGANIPNSVRPEKPMEKVVFPKAKAMPTGEARMRNWTALLPDMPKAYLEGIGCQEPRPEALVPLAEHDVSDACSCQKTTKLVTCIFMCGKYTYSRLCLRSIWK